jgi:hypothetical protein
MVDNWMTPEGISAGENAYQMPVVRVRNIDVALDVPAYGVVEIAGSLIDGSSLDADGTYRVQRPTSDNLLSVVFTMGPIPREKPSSAILGYEPVMVSYDTADGVPVVDGQVGTKSGSYLMSANNSGWVVMAVDSDNEVVYIKRAAGGTGSTICQHYKISSPTYNQDIIDYNFKGVEFTTSEITQAPCRISTGAERQMFVRLASPVAPGGTFRVALARGNGELFDEKLRYLIGGLYSPTPEVKAQIDIQYVTTELSDSEWENMIWANRPAVEAIAGLPVFAAEKVQITYNERPFTIGYGAATYRDDDSSNFGSAKAIINEGTNADATKTVYGFRLAMIVDPVTTGTPAPYPLWGAYQKETIANDESSAHWAQLTGSELP